MVVSMDLTSWLLWNWNSMAYNNGFRYDKERMGDEATRAFMIEAGLDADAARQSLGCGRGIRNMLAKLEEGKPPPAAHVGEEYEGNGSLIRLAPVPVFFAKRTVEQCLAVARAAWSIHSRSSCIPSIHHAESHIERKRNGVISGVPRCRHRRIRDNACAKDVRTTSDRSVEVAGQ